MVVRRVQPKRDARVWVDLSISITTVGEVSADLHLQLDYCLAGILFE